SEIVPPARTVAPLEEAFSICLAKRSAASRDDSVQYLAASRSSGVPGGICEASLTSSSTTSSYISSCTIKRLLEVQDWPVFDIRVHHACAAASATLSVSKMM